MKRTLKTENFHFEKTFILYSNVLLYSFTFAVQTDIRHVLVTVQGEWFYKFKGQVFSMLFVID